MARSVTEANAAIGRVRAMPYGRARSEAAEREVRRIEREGPDEARAYALTSLVEALTWGDQYESAFQPFTQLLRWWDAHPEHFDHYDQSVLFWEFGWIMSDLPQIPTVPRAQIEATLDDMERRFAVANRGIERVWSTRLDWALMRGERVDEVFTRWLTLPIDEEDSCTACHEALRAEYLLWSGRKDEAIAVLEAATASDLVCSREPAAMLTDLGLAYLDQGDWEAVETTLPKALAELKKAISTSLGSAFARVFEIYGRGRQPGLALDLLAERLKDVRAGPPYRQLMVLRRIVAGTTGLIQSGDGAYPVDLPTVPAQTIDHLHRWALHRAQPMAAAFDRRNGTAEQTRRLEAARAVVAAPRRLDFTRGTTRAAARLVREKLAAALDPDKVNQTHAASPRPTHAVPVIRPARARAEACLSAGDLAGAALAFEEAAGGAQEDGRLRESGWDWAEAAHCRHRLRQRAAANQAFAQAASRLRAADVPVEELARLLVAWAPLVRSRDHGVFVREALAAVEKLPGIVTDQDDGLSLADVAGFGLTFRPLRRQLRARADIDDSLARVLATWGQESEREDALVRARSAAEIYLSLGDTIDAAHAEWLTGRLAAEAGLPEEGLRPMEQAASRFQRAGRRERRHFAQVTEELADLLRDAGQDHRAEAVLRTLPVPRTENL